MKRLLAITAALLLAPITTLAISISELTSNPDQYKQIHEDGDYITYIDSNSIESLRYSPPYYTMRCTYYMASYNRDVIYGGTITVDYDYARSMKTLVGKIASEDKRNGITETTTQIMDKFNAEKFKDDGMRISLTNTRSWNIAGDFIGDISPSYGETHEYGTRIGIVASHLFDQYYNELF